MRCPPCQPCPTCRPSPPFPRPWSGLRARRPRPCPGSTACTSCRTRNGTGRCGPANYLETAPLASSCRHTLLRRGRVLLSRALLTLPAVRNIVVLYSAQPAHVVRSIKRKESTQMAEPKVGEKAPDFNLKSTSGDMVSLGQFKGQKNVLVAFFPLAFTGVCT